VTVDATTPAGASVSFDASASDAGGGTLQAVCEPASGATFPVATTTVRCRASDSRGQSTSGTFSVHVNGAGEQIDNLNGAVEAMNLDRKLADDLRAKLAVPAKKLGNPKDACDAMSDFPATVIDEAGKKTPRITIPQAQQLTGRAVTVEGALGCIPPGSPIGDAAHGLLELMQAIGGLGLNDGQTNELVGKAANAGKRLVERKADDACRGLTELAKRISDDAGKKDKLTDEQAAQLIASVARIRSSLGC
jgi:HYR domain